jgi:hypothetical protein
MGGQQVPPMMVASPDGLIPSDNYYADINGDHLPEIAIGRLPASTADELSGMISKIIAYENSAAGSWNRKVLLAADVPDEGGNFSEDIDAISTQFPSTYVVDKLYHSALTSSEMNTGLLSRINEGTAFISYFGHGGISNLSNDNILTTGDAASMTNGAKQPVMTAMTCVMGNFALPGITSLGEALVLNQNGGLAAVWTATGMSDDKLALKLDRAFLSAVLSGSSRVLGDLVLTAMRSAGLGADELYMLDMYVILGDPALMIRDLSKVPKKVILKQRGF